MEGRGILSPQRSRFSPKVYKVGTPEPKIPTRKVPSKKTDKSKQKLVPKTATLPSSRLKPPGPSTNPNPNDNKSNFNYEPPFPVPVPTQPTLPSPSSKTNIVRDYGAPPNFAYSPNGSPKISPTSALGPTKDLNTVNDLSDHLLQRLSFDGKDLADILQGKSIYDLISPKKKEESSSQSIDGWRVFQNLKEIAAHRQENLSVEFYFRKLKALWDELAFNSIDLVQCSSGGALENLGKLTEREKLVQFLMGLNDSYATICSQILVMTPFPTVEEAYSEIIGEEKRRELVVALETVAAKVIQSNWLLRNQSSRSKNGDNNLGIDQEVDNSNLGSPM